MKFKSMAKMLLIPVLAVTLSGCSRQKNDQDWCKLRNVNKNQDMRCLYTRTKLPDHALTIEDIIDITMDGNLTLLKKQHEYCIQRELVTREKFNMLPRLIVNWENSGRTENTASFSESLQPGVPPAPLSISSEQNIVRWDSGAIWNLVDFGVSFFRTQQEKNKVLMAQLDYERLRQTLIADIARQFWKATVSKNALTKSMEIIDKALDQQATLQRQMDSKIISEIQGLRNENQLINIRGQLQAYSAEYHAAKSELKLIMGVPASYDFEIADLESMGLDITLCDIRELENWALANRPELFSLDAEEQIRADEARAAIVQMMPGVELFGGPYHDSNRFLLHNNWLAAGIRATWNLLDFPTYFKEKEIACMRRTFAKATRVHLSAAILTQVNLSYILYTDHLESYLIAKELESVNKRLLLAAKNEQRQGKLHEADILKYEAEALFSEIDAMTKYAELQNTIEQLNSAIGMPRYFKTNTVFRRSNACVASNDSCHMNNSHNYQNCGYNNCNEQPCKNNGWYY
ncbi:MAG: TolC family protein [Chlamydiota bacterium]|nr:TolC family protein [Chlamydiota bacterium]